MISCFKYAFKNVPHRKRFHVCLSNPKKSTVGVPFTALGKLKVFDRPQIHTKRILRHPNKKCKVLSVDKLRKSGTQSTKTRKGKRRVRHKSR